MKKFALVPLLMFVAACGDTPTEVPAADEALMPTTEAMARAVAFTIVDTSPYSAATFVPCANDGAGEFVLLSGTLHSLYHLTLLPSGSILLKVKDSPQKMSGVGLTTGDIYQGNGVTQDLMFTAAGGFPYATTYVNNFLIIGQGPGNNYMVQILAHLTLNADGTTTVDLDKPSVECK